MKSVFLKVKVSAGAKKTEIKGKMADGVLRISITAPPEKNKANTALIKFLAAHFNTAPRNISIERGITSPSKLIKIIYD